MAADQEAHRDVAWTTARKYAYAAAEATPLGAAPGRVLVAATPLPAFATRYAGEDTCRCATGVGGHSARPCARLCPWVARRGAYDVPVMVGEPR